MLGPDPHTYARQLDHTTTTIGATLPKPVADAFDQHTAVTAAAKRIITPGQSLAQAVHQAILAGNDPATDPAVVRALNASALVTDRNITQGVEKIAAADLVAAIRDHSDEILAAWVAPFDQAATTIQESADRLGNVDLNDTNRIVRQGDDAAQVWAQATDAVATITTITNGWAALAHLTNTPNDPRHAALRIADATYDTWTAAGLRGRHSTTKATAWDLHRHGLTLSLATPDEYRRRITTVTTAPTDNPAAA